jgi:hypothetical protein
MDDALLSSEIVDANSFFIVHFATCRFRQKFDFPDSLLDILPGLTDKFVAVVDGRQSIPDLCSFLAELQNAHNQSVRFRDRLAEMLTKLQGGDLPKYVWEIASDLTVFSREFYPYVQASLTLVNQSDDRIDAILEQTLPQYEAILRTKKPRNAKDSLRISLNFADPQVWHDYARYAEAQRTTIKKCVECGEAACWFALPCSCPVYCQQCLDDMEGVLPEECPKCNKAVERCICITPPQ